MVVWSLAAGSVPFRPSLHRLVPSFDNSIASPFLPDRFAARVAACQACHEFGTRIVGPVVQGGTRMKLIVLDRVEDRFDLAGVIISPAGCCCSCCCVTGGFAA